MLFKNKRKKTCPSIKGAKALKNVGDEFDTFFAALVKFCKFCSWIQFKIREINSFLLREFEEKKSSPPSEEKGVEHCKGKRRDNKYNN